MGWVTTSEIFKKELKDEGREGHVDSGGVGHGESLRAVGQSVGAADGSGVVTARRDRVKLK